MIGNLIPLLQVLVVLFGERSCMWHSPAQLLPFKRHFHEKVAEGNELIGARKMARPGLFTRAVQVRYHCILVCMSALLWPLL